MASPHYYAVRIGRTPGVYCDWSACSAQVHGFSGARYKKFASLEAALRFVQNSGAAVPVVPPSRPHLLLKPHRQQQQQQRPERCKKIPKFDPSAVLPGVTVFTDGSCANNGATNARAGAGVYFGPDDPRNLAKAVPLECYAQTSTAAELYAALCALQVLRGHPEVINIVSDSTHLVEGITNWMSQWKASGRWIKPGAIANQRLWHDLDAAVVAHTPGVRFFWVKGHATCEQNKRADELAVLAVKRALCDF